MRFVVARHPFTDYFHVCNLLRETTQSDLVFFARRKSKCASNDPTNGDFGVQNINEMKYIENDDATELVASKKSKYLLNTIIVECVDWKWQNGSSVELKPEIGSLNAHKHTHNDIRLHLLMAPTVRLGCECKSQPKSQWMIHKAAFLFQHVCVKCVKFSMENRTMEMLKYSWATTICACLPENMKTHTSVLPLVSLAHSTTCWHLYLLCQMMYNAHTHTHKRNSKRQCHLNYWSVLHSFWLSHSYTHVDRLMNTENNRMECVQ